MCQKENIVEQCLGCKNKAAAARQYCQYCHLDESDRKQPPILNVNMRILEMYEDYAELTGYAMMTQGEPNPHDLG